MDLSLYHEKADPGSQMGHDFNLTSITYEFHGCLNDIHVAPARISIE